ncbi:MAG: hypothetical protein J6E46_10695 [Faecalicoccus sp.]|nr:hypothetical protein [Faecalicoccus sp.]
MRKNEYKALEEFKSQYIGIWNPSEGHWLGLDFVYKGEEYRFNTGSMYSKSNTILPDGKEAIFGLYRKNRVPKLNQDYELLGEFASMQDALDSPCINGIKFSQIIMDDETELVGQD